MSSTYSTINILALITGAFISGMVGIVVSEWKLRRDEHGRYLDKLEEAIAQVLKYEEFNLCNLHAELKAQLWPCVRRVSRHLWSGQEARLVQSWESFAAMTKDDLDTVMEEFLADHDMQQKDMTNMEGVLTAKQKVLNGLEMLTKPIRMF